MVSQRPIFAGCLRGILLCNLMLLLESGGLLARMGWAGWLVIGETAFFIPIEVYQLVEHVSTTLVVLLIINIFIVWFRVKSR